MPTQTARGSTGLVVVLGHIAHDLIAGLGELADFSIRTALGLLGRRLYPSTLLPSLYSVGVLSVPVVAITGLFIGMVMAVQSYSQFHNIGMDTHLGAVINITVISELGPVLAASMLAGRVGSAMAAELATMRTNEQIDALSCLGVNPHYYLVVPRFIACVALIPLLTVLADVMGVIGGALVCTQMFHVPAHHYWEHARGFIRNWDLLVSVVKPIFFGSAIAVISCYEGFHSTAGSEGVGRASTQAFVRSFIAILVLDFFLGLFLNSLYEFLWPQALLRMP
jgi:phospholipid/cholesterol/gamma-HCH transport system permease protein